MNVEGTDMYPSSEGRRAAARETTELLQDKDILLQEMQHRFSQWAGDRFERDRIRVPMAPAVRSNVDI